MKNGTKSTIFAISLFAVVVVVAIGNVIIDAHRNANMVYNSIYPNCVKIKYYTITQKLHVEKNDETGTEYLIFGNVNGGTFGVLMGQLEKKDWIFKPPAKNSNDKNSFWEGARAKNNPP